MSQQVRLATFNLENLYSRPTFWDPRRTDDQRIGNVFFEDRGDATMARRIVEAAWSDEKCQLTALALLETNADIIALQEVDNRNALKSLRDNYISKLAGNRLALAMKSFIFRQPQPSVAAVAEYRERLLAEIAYRQLEVIEGNDTRGIDVGFLARRPVISLKSHKESTFADLDVWPDGIATYNDGSPDDPRYLTKADIIFKRDCLEAVFDIGGVPLTVFICHFKSMSNGRVASRVMRQAEAAAVRRIVERRFGGKPSGANWAICGDLNDYYEIDGSRDLRDLRTGEPSNSGLGPLVDDGFAVDIIAAAAGRRSLDHLPSG